MTDRELLEHIARELAKLSDVPEKVEALQEDWRTMKAAIMTLGTEVLELRAWKASHPAPPPANGKAAE
jgi:hypothetical protein